LLDYKFFDCLVADRLGVAMRCHSKKHGKGQ
jgi:hypothetical protein